MQDAMVMLLARKERESNPSLIVKTIWVFLLTSHLNITNNPY